MTAAELKNLCAQNNLRISGKKSVLLARLADAGITQIQRPGWGQHYVRHSAYDASVETLLPVSNIQITKSFYARLQQSTGLDARYVVAMGEDYCEKTKKAIDWTTSVFEDDDFRTATNDFIAAANLFDDVQMRPLEFGERIYPVHEIDVVIKFNTDQTERPSIQFPRAYHPDLHNMDFYRATLQMNDVNTEFPGFGDLVMKHIAENTTIVEYTTLILALVLIY
ncbi:SAP domain-containing protein [bacterium]|nr:SAP domain-containing protein [bacterium]